MSVHISSDDVSSGSSYNGTFSFTETLLGLYKLETQYIDSTAIPWMWADCNGLLISATTGMDSDSGTVSFNYASIGSSSDTTAIAASFQSSVNAVTNAFVGAAARTCTVTYNSSLNVFSFAFNGTVTMLFPSPESTSRYVFNKFSDTTGNTINLSATFIDVSPKFLEMYIDESITEYNTSRNSYPTILLSTFDSEFVNQEIEFINKTNTLTISIYRLNVPLAPVPITNKWDLIFSL